jgi:hypothetical protein
MIHRFVLALFTCFFIQNVSAQPIIQVKPEAVSVGATYWESMFRATSYPISFAPYFAETPQFPDWVPNANSYSGGAGYGWQTSGHLDAQWKSVKAGQAKFWRYARWQTGIFYTGRIVNGQTNALNTVSSLPNGNYSFTYQAYQNSMQYRMLGLNIRWLQFLPITKKEALQLYTGLGIMQGWTFNNNIAQTEYFLQSNSSASGQLIDLTKMETVLPSVKGRNFAMTRPQLPLGIAWKVGNRYSIDAELNLALEWYTLKKRRSTKDEAHGFSLRIAHYF